MKTKYPLPGEKWGNYTPFDGVLPFRILSLSDLTLVKVKFYDPNLICIWYLRFWDNPKIALKLIEK